MSLLGGPYSNITKALIRKGNLDTMVDKREKMWRHKEKAVCKSKKDPWNGSFPHGTQKEPVLPKPWSQTSGLQNCEKLNFFSSSHPVWGNLPWQPEQTNIEHLSWHHDFIWVHPLHPYKIMLYIKETKEKEKMKLGRGKLKTGWSWF